MDTANVGGRVRDRGRAAAPDTSTAKAGRVSRAAQPHAAVTRPNLRPQINDKATFLTHNVYLWR